MQRLASTMILSLMLAMAPSKASAASDALVAIGVFLAGMAIAQPQTYPQGQPPVVVGQGYPQTYPQVAYQQVQTVRTQICVWQPFYNPHTGQPMGGRTNCYWQ
jgi:hypothetical protein